MMESAARFAILTSVTFAAPIVGLGYVPVRSPPAAPDAPELPTSALSPLAVPSVLKTATSPLATLIDVLPQTTLKAAEQLFSTAKMRLVAGTVRLCGAAL